MYKGVKGPDGFPKDSEKRELSSFDGDYQNRNYCVKAPEVHYV